MSGLPEADPDGPVTCSNDLLDFQDSVESNARSYPRRLRLAIASADRWWIHGADGRTYLDLLGGAGSLPLGHNPPEIIEVVQGQLSILTHGLDFMTEAKAAFIRDLWSVLPAWIEGYKIHFCGPTGADTVEAALKLARIATGRTGAIAFWGGYHGCTEGTLAVSANRSVRDPMLATGGATHAPFSYCLRCPLGMKRCSCDVNCATLFESVLTDPYSGTSSPAAVIVEPVQGEGGSIPADPEFLRRVVLATRAAGALLIVDEVQSGCGRTGSFLASQRYGIQPDIVCLSKALSGMGLPIGVILYRRELDVWQPGAHIGTFRGFQLAFAAGSRFLQIVRDTPLLEQVRSTGDAALRFLNDRLAGVPWVAEVRGAGLMLGIELDLGSAMASLSAARSVQSEALSRGVLVEIGGRDDSTIRLLPALNIPAEVLIDGLERLVASIIAADPRC